MTPQEIYIEVDSQELADELKEICIKYGLPIWEGEYAWEYSRIYCCFMSDPIDFWINSETQKDYHDKTQITKEQFIELLDNIKK